MAHVLGLFDARTGVWEADVVWPLHTGDVNNTPQVHDRIGEGDVVLGDDAFSTYAHVALLLRGKMNALFPNHHKRIVDFTPGRPHAEPGDRGEGKGCPSRGGSGPWGPAISWWNGSSRRLGPGG